MPANDARALPEATLNRLTRYLRALRALHVRGIERTSSGVLATEAGVNPAILRKDLSLLGSYGTRGVGYVVKDLADHIERTMGLDHPWNVAIIGAGNLGRALSGYGGFSNRGFNVKALLDSSADLIGTPVGKLRVQPVGSLSRVVEDLEINMAVLAIPSREAQQLVDELVEAGVRNILSFAQGALTVPDTVSLRRVDLSTELQILAYHAVQRSDEDTEK